MAGHKYELENIDDHVADIPMNRSRIDFVIRVGDKFPGNGTTSYSGCISQEVIRVLIDRTEYVDGQRPHSRNALVLYHLREAFRELEMRAAEERRADFASLFRIERASKPELMSTCQGCGHVECDRSHTT